VGVETFEHGGQVISVEAPVEWPGRLVVTAGEAFEATGEPVEVGEVGGFDDLALDHREDDLNLKAEKVEYRAEAAICNVCPRKAECTPSDQGRAVHRSFHAEYLERVHGYRETEAYKKAMRKRKVWIEPLFGEAKQWHGMRQFRLRGLMKVNMEGLFIAAGQNLKRLLSATGWGRRPWPDGAAGFTGLASRMRFALP